MRLISFHIIIACCSLISTFLFAQDVSKSALYKNLNNSQEQKEKGKSCLQLAELYKTEGNPDSSEYFYEQSLALHNERAYLSPEEKANAHYQIGNIQRQKSQYVNAVEHYEQSLSIALENGLKQREASTLNSMGGLYVEIEEYEKGLDYCKKGLAIYQEHFPEKEADICLLLMNIGNISIEMGQYAEAEVYLNEADLLNQSIQNDYYSALINSGLGLNYLVQREYDSALEYLNIALESARKSGEVRAEVASLTNIGQTYIEMQKYEDAEEVLLEAYDLSIGVGDKYLRKELLTTMIGLYSRSGQYERAFNAQVELTDLRDSIITKDLLVDVATAELKYKNAQNEKQILELEVKNERQSFVLRRNQYLMIFGFSLLALFAASLILIYQRNRLRNEAKIHQFENKMFRLQIKPHFIFNVLSSIQGYMNINEGKKASLYLSKFARLMRNILEQSRKDFVTVDKELKNIKYYVELQQLRFEDCFEYEFDVSPELDPEIVLIPPMLIQPIIENAVEHGFSRERNDGVLKLSIQKSNITLIVIIQDNGKGYPEEKLEEEDGKLTTKESLSTKMIQEQMKFFNAQLSGKFSIDYAHVSPEKEMKGTRVTLNIPYIEQNASD